MSLELVAVRGHEEVLVLQDAASGLCGVIAIHNTAPGPALIATRLRPAATLDAALAETLRLSCAMTLEAAGAGLAHGGGAAVFVGPAAAEKSRPLLAAYARVLDRFEGRALAVADSGFETRDLKVLGRMTRHVAGARGGGSDAADLTALGVLECVRATADRLETPLDRLHVALAGVGQVGYRLARLLAAEGVRLTAADTDAGRAERAAVELGAAVVTPDALATTEADVFSPNTAGVTLDEAQAARLRSRAVVGGGRDVLADEEAGETLHRRGILYAPDIIAAAAGLAAVSVDAEDEMAVQERVADVGTRLQEVWSQARAAGVSPARAAIEMAQARLAAGRKGGRTT